MSDLIDRMMKEHWRQRTEVGASPYDSMKAALAILSKPENITDEMAIAAAMTGVCNDASGYEDIRNAIAAAISSLLKE